MRPQSSPRVPLVSGEMASFPETRFVRSDGVDIGYQVVGNGEIDVVFVPGWISNWEVAWELPESARFLERVSQYSRLILFDKRGTGLSDRVPGLPTLEQHVDDLRAVLDAVGSTRGAVTGWADGAAVAILFAALYPERVTALVVGSVVAKARGDGTDQPLAIDPEVMDQWGRAIESSWGEGTFLPMLAPSVAGDARFAAWWRRLERSSVTPNAAARFFRSMLELDVTAILPTIQVPTLVIHRRDAPLLSADAARWFAEQIPGARYLEVPGADALPYVGDVDVVLDEVEEFLTGARGGGSPDRVLATVLFIDVSGSTALAQALGDRRWRDVLEDYRRTIRVLLERFRGQEIDTAGDGFLATFDGPARAIRCALSIQEGCTRLGLEVHAGLHTGEVELHGGSISGLAVHIGARVGAVAKAGEVLVTSTVKDLVLGSGLSFTDGGRHVLKGVDGEWQLFRAVPG